MAVYREGYMIVEQIEKGSIQIYSDACDYGYPTRKGDFIWNAAKQISDWYGLKGTRIVNKYGTGYDASIDIELIDEWAVSDKRKTEVEATDVFLLTFVSCTDGKCKEFDGFLHIYKK